MTDSLVMISLGITGNTLGSRGYQPARVLKRPYTIERQQDGPADGREQ